MMHHFASVCAVFLLTLTTTSCHSVSSVPLPQAPMPVAQARNNVSSQSAQVLSAKYALDKAERYALAWSSEAALTHVFGQYITQQGLPDRRRGSWTFSFVDYDAPEKGFQVHMQAGKPDVYQAMPASRLPLKEPLEIRAWNYDSHQLVPIIRQLFPDMSTPLPDIQLVEVDRRLVWSLGDKQWVDAMNGRIFTP